jgi:hypothetical protein
MAEHEVDTNEPFWIDYPRYYGLQGSSKLDLGGWGVAIGILRVAMHLLALAAIALVALIYPWAWIVFLAYVAIIALIVVSVLTGRQLGSRIGRIQQSARETTGAEYIGSALHAAGHPLLQVDQPVVLALKGTELSIYGYSNSTPLDRIPIGKIESLATVVYDEDRIPHTAVADKTAQALQITFQWRDETCVAVFRMMRHVRPIDWYQAIQAARLTR